MSIVNFDETTAKNYMSKWIAEIGSDNELALLIPECTPTFSGDMNDYTPGSDVEPIVIPKFMPSLTDAVAKFLHSFDDDVNSVDADSVGAVMRTCVSSGPHAFSSRLRVDQLHINVYALLCSVHSEKSVIRKLCGQSYFEQEPQPESDEPFHVPVDGAPLVPEAVAAFTDELAFVLSNVIIDNAVRNASGNSRPLSVDDRAKWVAFLKDHAFDNVTYEYCSVPINSIEEENIPRKPAGAIKRLSTSNWLIGRVNRYLHSLIRGNSEVARALPSASFIQYNTHKLLGNGHRFSTTS